MFTQFHPYLPRFNTESNKGRMFTMWVTGFTFGTLSTVRRWYVGRRNLLYESDTQHEKVLS